MGIRLREFQKDANVKQIIIIIQLKFLAYGSTQLLESENKYLCRGKSTKKYHLSVLQLKQKKTKKRFFKMVNWISFLHPVD